MLSYTNCRSGGQFIRKNSPFGNSKKDGPTIPDTHGDFSLISSYGDVA